MSPIKKRLRPFAKKIAKNSPKNIPKFPAMLNAQEFFAALNHGGSPPAALSLPQLALWHAKIGNWDRAHDLSQDIPDPDGAWIHAYLHRQEGDLPNAAYWYHRANRSMPASSVGIEQEWQNIATFFCQQH
jgi:hypothetical protein